MYLSNAKRIEDRINKIASFSDEENKITRLTYKPAWVKAIKWLTEVMKSLDMTVRMDTFGNLIGTYNPAESKEKPVAMGSHIDTVRNGGAFDGVAGIIVGLEIVSMLKENNIKPPFPVEVIATADEEGAICQKGYFGARFMTGSMSPDEALTYKDIDGNNLASLQKESKMFEGKTFGSDCGWAKNFYQKFIEVHVEQGNVLESCNKKAGVVKGIVGIGRIFIDFYGESDHAGPTLMKGRKDSLVATADMISKVWKLGQEYNGKAVLTIARISNTPNIHNVISGKTSFIVDYRSEDDETAMLIADKVRKMAENISGEFGVRYKITKETYTPPVVFRKETVDEIRKLDLPDSMELFSWAGHDAKAFSEVVPTAMIFMPSINGKSHSPLEKTGIKSFTLVCDRLINLFC